jgi:DNA-binding MarR family transcriptional regulator
MAFNSPSSLPLIEIAQEFIDLLFWKFHRILDQEGVSELQWAFMQRASRDTSSVPFSVIRTVTGESMSNVRRAASSLEEANVGKVEVNPADRRERIFTLTKLGRRRANHVREAYKAELLTSIGAREIFSKRVLKFTELLSHASFYLASGDLAKKELRVLRGQNRSAVPDDSLRYGELPKRAKALFVEPEKVPF